MTRQVPSGAFSGNRPAGRVTKDDVLRAARVVPMDTERYGSSDSDPVPASFLDSALRAEKDRAPGLTGDDYP